MSLIKKGLRLSGHGLTLSLVLMVGAYAADPPAKKELHAAHKTAQSAQSGTLWLDPLDLETRDLFYGSGGEKRAPTGTEFTFEKEDMNGTNPKLEVRAADGTKWKVKVGTEARPETSATRFVWAVGYFTTNDYLLPEIKIDELPKHLHRGRSLFGDGSQVANVRFKRPPEGYEKAGTWRWKDEAAQPTREYNGLRVLMALINNWDLKDDNNEAFDKKKEKDADRPARILLVTDLGASFGTVGLGLQHIQRKGNLAFYQRSKFIVKTTPEYVDFSVPARPGFIVLFNPREYFSRVHEEWIGRHIPRADVRWMGELLGRLSDAQIRDAFRAGGFSPPEIDGFAAVVEARISELKNL
jgi:hypothetical protein